MAGNYEMEFILSRYGRMQAKLNATFEVPKRTEIDVKLISRPQYVRADDTVRSQFMISNTGNDRESLTLYSRNCIVLGDNTIQLPPDSVMIVDVHLIPNKELMRIDDRAIDLSVAILGVDRVVSDQEIVRIYPVKTVKIDPYLRFPISFNSNYVYRTSNGESTLNTYQFQISGKGSLDTEKKHRLQFEYRGPGSIRVARVGNFAQKYVQYSSKRIDVFVGEKTFGLSNLTENFRFGTGLDVNAKLSPNLKIGSYYNKPLLQPEFNGQAAAYLEYQTTQKHKYRLNAIRSDMKNGEAISLASLQTTWTNGNDWSLNTEVSRSMSQVKDGGAYSYTGTVDIKRFKFASSGLYADPNFPGYFSNSAYLSVNMGYNLKKIGFQLGGNFNDENPNLDTVYSAAPYSIFLNGGLIGKFTKSWDLQLLALYREKVDRLNSKRFDYQERRIRFASTFRRGYWSTRFLGEAGVTTNLLVDNSSEQQAFGYDGQLHFTYHSSQKLSASIFGQFLSNTRFSKERFSYLLYGADLQYQLHSKLSIEMELQNNYLVEDLYNDRNLINFKTNYAFHRNHRISAHINYGILHQGPIRRDWYYAASYNFKLGIPLKKLMSLGSVEGQLLNEGVASVSKIVLMMDGQLVTTDNEGHFKFNNVKPGMHQVFIDKKTIGVRDMPNRQLPIEIEVFPDRVSKISFAMTRSSSLRGVVNMAKVHVVQSSKEKIVMPRVIVEVSNGVESKMSQANERGEFYFGSLRPGTWTVRLVPTYWKDKFTIKEGETTIVLQPEVEGEVSFLIEPKIREVKFLKQGTIKLGGK